jgi:hypothetical protein
LRKRKSAHAEVALREKENQGLLLLVCSPTARRRPSRDHPIFESDAIAPLPLLLPPLPLPAPVADAEASVAVVAESCAALTE